MDNTPMVEIQTPVAGFFDIDGTIVQNGPSGEDGAYAWSKRPSTRVMQSIERFAEGGNYAFICSGRPLASISSALLSSPFIGAITMAGAQIYLNEELVFDLKVPEQLLISVAENIRASRVSGLFESPNKSVLLKGENADWPVMPGTSVVHDIAGLNREVPGFDYRKVVIREPDLRRLLANMPSLKKNASVYSIGHDLFEITSFGVNKGKGVFAAIELLERQGMPVRGSLGFGDSENDLTMFKAVDVSVAMGNASTYVKRQATLVTDSVSNDGVASALEHLGLVAG